MISKVGSRFMGRGIPMRNLLLLSTFCWKTKMGKVKRPSEFLTADVERKLFNTLLSRIVRNFRNIMTPESIRPSYRLISTEKYLKPMLIHNIKNK